MAKSDDKIKDLFSSKLDNFEPEMPFSIWEELDQQLSEETLKTNLEEKKKVSPLKLVLFASGIAASLLLGVFIAFNQKSVTPSAPTVVEEIVPAKEEVIDQEKIIVSKVVDKEVLAASETLTNSTPSDKGVVRTKNTFALLTPTEVKEKEKFVEKESVDEPEILAVPDQERKEEIGNKVQEEPKEEKATETQPKKAIHSLYPKEEYYAQANSQSNKNNVSLGLRSNTGALSSTTNQNENPLLFSSADRSSSFVSVLEAEKRDTELSHKQPISVGVTVSKSLTNRLSVETGIMFTYLSSKIKSSSSTNIKERIKEEQEFGYLGIPLYLNYNFYDLGKAKFYVSLGAVMQKDIYGHYTSELLGSSNKSANLDGVSEMPSYTLYSEPGYIKKSINQSHWQFSSHLTVGASYPIYRRLHVHASVGGAYYFDAKNEYKTIYSDRPFQLDLNLGLRFDF